MLLKWAFSLSALFTITSCSSYFFEQGNTENAPDSVVVRNSAEISTAGARPKPAEKQQSLNKEKTPENHLLVSINNQRIELESLPLLANQRVFNHDTKREGRVTGRYLVVLDDKSGQVLDILNSRFKLVRVSANIYRIRSEPDWELLNIYKILLNTKGVKRVEMEIDYSTPRN